jgi:hypothetical protein
MFTTENIATLDRTPSYNGVNSKLPNALFNDIDPAPGQYVPKKEQPAHRLMVCMAANGFTITEIAEKMQRTVSSVSTVLRQPWARARLTAMMQEAGMDELQRLIKQEASGAIIRIVARAKDKAVDPGVRQRADEYLGNRYLGKPKETVEVSTKPLDKLTDAELTSIITSAAAGSSIEQYALPVVEAEVSEQDKAPEAVFLKELFT